MDKKAERIPMVQLSKYPATNILTNSKGSWENRLPSREELFFYYRVVLRSIDALLHYRYTEFDAHTTSNCCHGMAIFVQELILSTQSYDLLALQQEGQHKLQELEESESIQESSIWQIPASLIDLSRLYVISYIKESDISKGRRTTTNKLQNIASLSKNYCNKISHNLQKHFSNLIALRYKTFGSLCKHIDFQICGVPLLLWEKYSKDEYLRTDKKGLVYAPCLFTMQVSLSYLIIKKTKIVIKNDIKDQSNNLLGRYIQILEGDGRESFKPLTDEQIENLNPNEPLVIFAGCAHSEASELERIKNEMNTWLHKIPNLVLGCDTHYPQFPHISDDPDFEHSTIVPDEFFLREVISHHSKIEGVSSTNPSLFCLNHIYSASVEQVFQATSQNNETALPVSFIPKFIRENYLSPCHSREPIASCK